MQSTTASNKTMKRLLQHALVASLILLMPVFPGYAAEQDDEAIDKLTRLLKLRLGIENIDPPVETEVEGVYQTRFGNKFAYLIEGGRYVFIGDMIDLKLAKNLTELSRRDMIVKELASFPDDALVIFPARDPELAVLNVFTDTSCGYCQKLHREVGFLQDAGISVRYFPYPRGGARGPGYKDLQKVWCAEDRATAMSIAKGTANGRLDSGLCEAAKVVDQGYELGNRIGVTGTPALFTADGTKFNGYVPYQELIPQLLDN